MSLSIEQLKDNLALRKTQDGVDWDVSIAYEVANGRLQHLQARRVSSQELYGMAIDYLNEDTPNVLRARLTLAGCQQLDNERGTGTSGADALAALSEYEASVISMDAAVVDEPDVEEGEGDVA